jgi:outer membrane immunogenic protein
MKHTLATLTVSALALLSGAAQAADLGGGLKDGASYGVTGYNWTGFYAGANAGYGTAGTRDAVDMKGVASGVGSTYSGTYSGSISHPGLDGAVGGAQVGWNIQRGHLVAGVVTDFQFSGLSNSGSANVPVSFGGGHVGDLPLTASQQLDWFGTVRGKLGAAFDRVLVYGTAGYAYGRVTDKIATNFPGDTNYSASNSTVRSGWAAGAGAEYALPGGIRFGIDYMYMDLGQGSVTSVTGLGGSAAVKFATSSINSDEHIVRATVNFPLGGN